MRPLFKSIVSAISGSEASINAAKYAIVLAKQYKCRLTFVYVVDTATLKQLLMTKIFVQEESQEYEESLKQNGERYLAYAEDLAKKKGVAITRRLCQGAVYTEVIKVAEDEAADLLILGGWEANRNAKDIIADAHRQILFHAKTSVLIMKEENVDQLYKSL